MVIVVNRMLSKADDFSRIAFRAPRRTAVLRKNAPLGGCTEVTADFDERLDWEPWSGEGRVGGAEDFLERLLER